MSTIQERLEELRETDPQLYADIMEWARLIRESNARSV